MSIHKDEAAAELATAVPTGSPRFFKTHDFWTASPAACFGVAKVQFLLRGTMSQRDRFALIAAVLTEASACRAAHILTAPGDNCFNNLKAQVTHQLTAFQKAEKLFSSEPMGDRHPLELLSKMLELIHPREKQSRLFAMLFMRRFPAAVRLQLSENTHEDGRALADKTDRCTASIHSHQQFLPVSAATFDDCEVKDDQPDYSIAVGSNKAGCFFPWSHGGQNCPKGGRGGQHPQLNCGSSKQEPSQTQLAKQAGLCRNHFIYSDKTYNCGGNCSWSGN